MKKLIFSVLFAIAFTSIAQAQKKVEKIELEGDVYTVCQEYPAAIIGLYQYVLGSFEPGGNNTFKQPIVELNADGTGRFQRHDVPANKIKYWIDCDEKGNLRKQEGFNGRYGLTILYQYLDGDRAGDYNLMNVAVVGDEGYAVILGERYKILK